MHEPSVALYWDPSISNNGFHFQHSNVKPQVASTSPSHPSTGCPDLQNFSQDGCDHSNNILPETSLIQHNISKILSKYDGVYAYADPKDFILHLYKVCNQFSFDSNPTAKSNSTLHNPILLVMVPSASTEHYTIVRFIAFVAFNIPSIPVVLTSSSDNQPTYVSCGVSNIFSLSLTDEVLADIEKKSNLLTERMVQDCQNQLVSQQNSIDKSNLSSMTSDCYIPFHKSSQHIQYFMSALEHFHTTNTSKEYQLLIESHPSNSEFLFSEHSYPSLFNLTVEQIIKVRKLIGDWDFYAHELNYDELLFAAYAIIKHGFALPSVDDLRLDDKSLLKFLLIVRDSYRPSNPYHNFRHAIDVLQATFYFLLQLHSLPEYPLVGESSLKRIQESILTPIETLTILIVATGHDVGHPGVTNVFLTSSQAPLASVFDNKSVLESYHSAAFSEILKRYWPNTQDVPVCKLIVQSVLATDMARHFDYMEEVTKFLESPLSSNGKDGLQYRTLICCLLIKCADISNVARKLEISSQWGLVLSKEFAEVEILEIALGLKIPLSPVGPVEADFEDLKSGAPRIIPRHKLVALAKGQIFFINTFAKPLFFAVSKLLPQLSYTLGILEENASIWASKLQQS